MTARIAAPAVACLQKRRRGDVRPKSAHELLAEHELEAEGRGKEQDEEDEREEDGDSDSERREQEGSGDGSAGSPQDGSKQASGGKPAPWRRMQLLLPRQQLASYLSAAVVTYASPEMTREVLRLWNKQEHGCWTLLLSAGPLGTGTAGAARNADDGNGVAGQGGGGDAEVGHKCVLLHDLVRQAFAPVPSVPVQSVMDAVRVITGVRPGAVLDQDQEGRIALSVALRGCASDAGAVLGSKGSKLAVLLAPLTYFTSENACLVQEATLDWAYKSQVWEEAAVKPLVGQVEAWFEDRKRKQAQAKEQDEMQRNGSASLPPACSGSFSTAATAAVPRPAAATPAAAQAPSAAAPAPSVPPPPVPQRLAGPPPVASSVSAVGPAPQAPSPRQPTAGPPGFPGGPRPTAASPPGFPLAGPHMAPLPASPYPGSGGPYQASSHPAPHPGGPYPGGPYPGAMYHPDAPPPPYPGVQYPGGPYPGHPAPMGYQGGPPMHGPFMGPPLPYMQPGPAARMPPGFGPAPESVAPGGAMPPVAVLPIPMPPPMIIRPVIQSVLPHLPRPPPPAVMMPPPGTAPSAQAHPQAEGLQVHGAGCPWHGD